MKTKFAIDFVNKIRDMDKAALTKMINEQAGEELAQFFMNYGKRVLENGGIEPAASLMLMGYLIRAAEDEKKAAAPVAFPQKMGLA